MGIEYRIKLEGGREVVNDATWSRNPIHRSELDSVVYSEIFVKWGTGNRRINNLAWFDIHRIEEVVFDDGVYRGLHCFENEVICEARERRVNDIPQLYLILSVFGHGCSNASKVYSLANYSAVEVLVRIDKDTRNRAEAEAFSDFRSEPAVDWKVDCGGEDYVVVGHIASEV